MFLDRIGILVVSLGHASPLAVHLQQQQVIGKVDPTAPVFLQHPYHSQGFLHSHHIDTRPETGVRSDSIYILVKLLDAAVFQLPVQIAEQDCA